MSDARMSTRNVRPKIAAAIDRPKKMLLARGRLAGKAVVAMGQAPARRLMRISMRRAMANTMNVMTKRMRPSAISDEV